MTPDTIEIDSVDAYERGHQRGLAIRHSLPAGIRTYLALFEVAGVSAERARVAAEQTVEATRLWRPALVDEMRGTAAGSGTELWQIAALNARTEILSSASGAKPGECSTVVNAGGSPVGAQTWDWHEELSNHWHLQQIRGTARAFVGLTEHGILCKIGMNDAGIGVMLNILGHQADRPDGVPIHLVLACVLAEASTLAETIAILESAPVSTSSAITVLSPEGAVIVELSPVGARVLQPVDDVLVHTNHFLDPLLSMGERPGLYDPDSQLRLGVLLERTRIAPLPTSAAQLVPYLLSNPSDAAQLCCIPAPGATLGDRWATLATVTMDSATRTMTVSAGSPAEIDTAETVALVAPGDFAPAVVSGLAEGRSNA